MLLLFISRKIFPMYSQSGYLRRNVNILEGNGNNLQFDWNSQGRPIEHYLSIGNYSSDGIDRFCGIDIFGQPVFVIDDCKSVTI
jgi:YD repeat-containing protein